MSTQFAEINCDAGVMITASHLPPNRNGFKFFTKKAGLEKKDITEILSFAEANIFPIMNQGAVEKIDIITPYSKFIVDFVRNNTNSESPLRNLKIVVDAGNGAGGFFADKILTPLGANTNGSIYLDPDGNFPNHVPNPEDKEAIESIQQAVTKNSADLGIIFDTDVDRAAVVDKDGNPINRNALIALLSAIILKEHPDSTIVTDSVTSEGLKTYIEQIGGKHHRFKRGYKNVINESIRLNEEGTESWLAIETSGHAAFRENHFLDDGAFLVAKILVEVSNLSNQGDTISSLLKNLSEPAKAAEFRLKINSQDFKTYGQSVIDALKTYVYKQKGWEAEKENHEGLRVKCDTSEGDGWFLLRLSLHDPVLPLNIESNTEDGIKIIASRLRIFLKEFELLSNKELT
jgi:phosphomannomutase